MGVTSGKGVCAVAMPANVVIGASSEIVTPPGVVKFWTGFCREGASFGRGPKGLIVGISKRVVAERIAIVRTLCRRGSLVIAIT